MKQFEDLTKVVNFLKDKDVSKKVTIYINVMKTLKILLVVLFIAYIGLIVFEPNTYKRFRTIFILCEYVDIVCYIVIKSIMAKWVKTPLFSNCNGTLTLLRYMALAERATRNKSWGMHFYNISSTLYYEGRFDEAKAVVLLMDTYARSNLDIIQSEILKCRFAFYDKDLDALKMHSSKLAQITKNVHLRQPWKFFQYVAMQQPILLLMEMHGNYQELYELYRNAEFYKGTTLSKVQQSYYMFCSATLMGNKEKAKIHQDFVLKYGGTLWYRKVLND